MYTSGTTGNPKGVLVTHQNFINFLIDMTDRFSVTDQDKVLSLTNYTFDISMLELFLPLINKAQIILSETNDKRYIDILMDTIKEKKPTIIQATPATWKMLFQANLQLKTKTILLCGGERLPQELASKFININQKAYNMYGPTETTIWSTCAEIKNEQITIGKPISTGLRF